MINPLKTNIPELFIYKAEPGDETLILDFIVKLAEYEKLSHEVKANADDIKKHLFGKKVMAEVIFAVFKEKPVGFALFFHNFSTFVGKPGIYLEDLFVLEEYRGSGFGKELLVQLAKIARERNCGRLEWAVLDWNEPAIKFYQSIGAKMMDEWRVNRLSEEGIEELGEWVNG